MAIGSTVAKNSDKLRDKLKGYIDTLTQAQLHIPLHIQLSMNFLTFI
jgi:hypothetical protein